MRSLLFSTATHKYPQPSVTPELPLNKRNLLPFFHKSNFQITEQKKKQTNKKPSLVLGPPVKTGAHTPFTFKAGLHSHKHMCALLPWGKS